MFTSSFAWVGHTGPLYLVPYKEVVSLGSAKVIVLLCLSTIIACSAIVLYTAQTSTAQPRLWIRHWLLHHNHRCLVGIIDRENRTYDPTLNYGGGHGNVYVAYGLPQADPGTKMRSAGRDWRINPRTQIRWMIGYTRGRYGSECNALYHRIVYHTY